MLSEQEKTQIYFNRDFFPAVAVVVAKAPCFLNTIAGLPAPLFRPLGAKILFDFNSRDKDTSEQEEDDDVVHCRIYTWGGYAPSLVWVNHSRLV